MPQFDVLPTTFPEAPLVLDVQSDLLDSLNTRVVIPLEPATNLPPQPSRLHPRVHIDGQPYILATAKLAAVHTGHLKPPVHSLAATHRQHVIEALDFLVHGF